MMYKITSDDTNQLVELFTSVFERTNSGYRGWSVTELYRGAVAYRGINECPTKEEYNKFIICNPTDGPGVELFTSAGVMFSFDESYDHKEQAAIKQQWTDLNKEMLGKQWRIEEEFVKIPAGFRVDLVRPVKELEYEVVEDDLLLCDYAD